MSKQQQDEFMKEVARDAPTTNLMRKEDNLPVKPSRTHPMAIGLKEAKQLIARILESEPNLKKLKKGLQEEFNANPTKFFRMYEPLLRRYEDVDKVGLDDRASIHVTGPTIIMTGDGDGNPVKKEEEDGGEDN